MEYGRFQQCASSNKINLHLIVVGLNDNRGVRIASSKCSEPKRSVCSLNIVEGSLHIYINIYQGSLQALTIKLKTKQQI